MLWFRMMQKLALLQWLLVGKVCHLVSIFRPFSLVTAVPCVTRDRRFDDICTIKCIDVVSFSALAKDKADSMVEKRCGFGIIVVIVMGFSKCVSS